MKVQIKKVKKLLMLFAFCGLMSFGSNLKVEQQNGKAYIGIGYLATKKKNISAEASVGIGVVGLYAAGTQGMIYGAAFGMVPGAIVGGVIGL